MSADRIGDLFLILILIGFVAFMVIYTLTARWWRSEMGRHVAAFMSVAMLVVGIRVSRMIWGDYAIEHELRAVGLALCVGVVYWRVALLFKAQAARRGQAFRQEPHEVTASDPGA